MQHKISPLLKLHGSINWGRIKKRGIVPLDVGEASFNIMSHTTHVLYNLGTRLGNRKIDGISFDGPPIIVPPTWNKNSYHGQIANVWAAATRELALAENIIVIGYSLPETDSFFRYLYALGSQSSARLRNFIVINPDNSGGVEGRFRELIGKGIESRFRYEPSTFTEGLSIIERPLLTP